MLLKPRRSLCRLPLGGSVLPPKREMCDQQCAPAPGNDIAIVEVLRVSNNGWEADTVKSD